MEVAAPGHDWSDLTYGAEWSARWERDFGWRPDTADAVDRLAELARGEAVLELGVGTGRLALPLAERGLAVHGVDSSPWMLAQLRANDGGGRVTTSEADIAEGRFGGPFGLVVLASFTISALADQTRQLDCVANAARHLSADGAFVVEAMAPRSEAIATGSVRAVRVDADKAVLHLTAPADPLTNVASACHVYLHDGEAPRLRPIRSRHVWPAELDLMARLAGLTLVERWGGWDRRAFGADCAKHVSVYGWTKP